MIENTMRDVLVIRTADGTPPMNLAFHTKTTWTERSSEAAFDAPLLACFLEYMIQDGGRACISVIPTKPGE